MFSIEEIGDIVVKSLMKGLGDHLVAVALFGSRARGEADEKSDIDLFIVVKDILKDDVVNRRLAIYRALSTARAKLWRDTSIIDVDEEDLKRGKLTPLLINIARDAIILYDREKYTTQLFKRINDALEDAELIRYRLRDGSYGWKRLKPGRIILRV